MILFARYRRCIDFFLHLLHGRVYNLYLGSIKRDKVAPRAVYVGITPRRSHTMAWDCMRVGFTVVKSKTIRLNRNNVIVEERAH